MRKGAGKMPALLEELVEEREEIRKWSWKEPITFNDFLDLYMGMDDSVELVDGEVIERKMVQFDHENLLMWLLNITGVYAEKRRLGMVLGSRSAVKISDFRGRLPDMIFIRADRRQIIQQKALYEAPDLIVEIRSPGNRKSHMIGLETDYQHICAQEIVTIDPIERKVRSLRRRDGQYDVAEQSTGVLEFQTIPGLNLDVEWFFSEKRPDALDIVLDLLVER